MDITANRDSLLSELRICADVADKRGLIPILSHVKIAAEPDGARVSIEATDTRVTAHLLCDATVRDGGGFVIDLPTLLDFVKNAPDDTVTLATDERAWVRVESGTTKFRLPALPADDFPLTPEADGDVRLDVDLPLLCDAIHPLLYAIGSDARFTINGVMLISNGNGHVDACAVDGHRLALAVIESRGANIQELVPPSVARLLHKLRRDESVTLRVSEMEDRAFIQFQSGAWIAFLREHNARFLNYRQGIPIPEKSLMADRVRMIAAVRRAMLLTPSERKVDVTVKPGRVSVRPHTTERGEGSDYLAADCTESMEFSATGTYIIEALEALDCERVTIGYANSVITVQPQEQQPPIEWLHLIALLSK